MVFELPAFQSDIRFWKDNNPWNSLAGLFAELPKTVAAESVRGVPVPTGQ